MWRALTEPALRARWLAPDDFVAEEGREFVIGDAGIPGFGGRLECRVTEVAAPEGATGEGRLAWSQHGGGLATGVRFTIRGTPVGTRVDFTLGGLRGPRGFFVRRILARAWTREILPRRLARVVGDV